MSLLDKFVKKYHGHQSDDEILLEFCDILSVTKECFESSTTSKPITADLYEKMKSKKTELGADIRLGDTIYFSIFQEQTDSYMTAPPENANTNGFFNYENDKYPSEITLRLIKLLSSEFGEYMLHPILFREIVKFDHTEMTYWVDKKIKNPRLIKKMKPEDVKKLSMFLWFKNFVKKNYTRQIVMQNEK